MSCLLYYDDDDDADEDNQYHEILSKIAFDCALLYYIIHIIRSRLGTRCGMQFLAHFFFLKQLILRYKRLDRDGREGVKR